MAIKWDRLTVKSQEAVQAASGFAAENGNPEVLPLHLMLALSKAKNDPVQLALAALGGTHEAILKALSAVRGSQRVTDQTPEGKFQALEKYAKDLTDLARRGKLDPVIGRDDEIRRVVQVLSRRTKNNP